MKFLKLFCIFLFLCFANLNVFAKDEIAFIYLNGSNNNDDKAKQWFYDGINKFHPYLKKNFEEDEFARAKLLDNGKYVIKNCPEILYWGDLSKSEISALNKDLDWLKFKSPKAAQFVRQYIAKCLHDAIWISKFPSMYPLLNKLHTKILKEYENGNKTVLLGYSAGTFVTQQYYLIKLPVINFDELYALSGKTKEIEFIKSKNVKPTCVDALFKGSLVTYDITGGMIANPNPDIFKEGVEKLNDYTKQYCAPEGAVIGVINYASPIVLFYSEFNDPRYRLTELGALTYKYVIENDMFWLTVNYSDDPLGFPTTKNITLEEVEEKTGINISPEKGFFYDKSDASSRRTFLMAHTSYWATSKRYSKLVVKAYKEGYMYFHKLNE